MTWRTEPLPEAFVRTITELRGHESVAWLERLPALLRACEERWSLTLSPPFANLSYNYVAPAVRSDGTSVVLKIGFPNDKEFPLEAAALRTYDGHGAVRLLDADLESGVLLLERLVPGTPLLSMAETDDERATAIAAQVMGAIRRSAPPADAVLPTVADWGKGLRRLREHFGGGTGPFPEPLVERAAALFAELDASASERVLLHGDLHHSNILAAEREPWLAIDPKGVIGDPAYETAPLLRNPFPRLLDFVHPARTLARRIDQLAEALNFDRKRIHGWALAQAVLSAWWFYEDQGHGWEYDIAVAQLLEQV